MTKKYLWNLVMLFGGNLCASLGVFLCIMAGKGADPITVVMDGLANTFQVSIGTAVIIFHGVLMTICFIFDRKSIKFGTIFSILSFSVCLDVLMINCAMFINASNFLVSWILLMSGILCIGIGFSLGIFAGIGCNTADIALNILSSKTNFSIKICKWALDICYTIIGIILGGQFGVGTLLCVLSVGCVYSYTLSALEKIIKEQVVHNKKGIENYV